VVVKLYVEGGGDTKALHSRCRQGFRELLENCGFKGRMPQIIACVGRQDAFEMFLTATMDRDTTSFPILLVDSEEIVIDVNFNLDSPIAWKHILKIDKFTRPSAANNIQAQLMATCMETWIMADHSAIIQFFGPNTIRNSLLPVHELEKRGRHEVQDTLVHATSKCGRHKSYNKGRHSFGILGILSPEKLQTNLPHFHRFKLTLDQILH